MIGYSAELFVVFCSPLTGFTSTFTDVLLPIGIVGKSLNVTVFVSPGSITGMVAVLTIWVGDAGMVSVTWIWTSCELPPLWTATSNPSAADYLIVVSATPST